MAIFLHEDVRNLLWEKMVVIIGDSVQRAVYKDLVCLLVEKDSRYLSNSELKSKGELKFLGDELLSGGQLGEMTNGKNYRETRRFDSGHTIVKFYFVTRCFSEHVQSILDEVKQFPPHVIIMNSCLWDLHRYGLHGLAAFKMNLGKLMFALNSTLDSDCVFIWNATLPLASKCKGGFLLPLFDTIPSLEIMEANFFVRNVMSSSKRLFLDLHAIFSQQLHRRAKDGVHWDKVAHRYITNLLLTELSRLWNVAIPRRTLIALSRPSPNSWNNLCQPVTPTRPGLLPTPSALLPTPPSRNNSMLNFSYTSLLGQMFRPATPVHPLSVSFSGQTGFLNKYIVDGGALSDGNDYEDVETAREYKQKFRFGCTSSPMEKTHKQGNGPNGEKPKSESKPIDPKICIDEEGKQVGKCPTSVGDLPAVQTDSELNEKTREFESDVQLDREHVSENGVRPIPRSSSFICTRSSSLAERSNGPASADSSDLYTDYYRDAEECEVDTEFVDNQHSFTEEPIRSSTPCLARQPTAEQQSVNISAVDIKAQCSPEGTRKISGNFCDEPSLSTYYVKPGESPLASSSEKLQGQYSMEEEILRKDDESDYHPNKLDVDLGCSEPPSIEDTLGNGVLPDCSYEKESVGDLPVEKVANTICSSVISSEVCEGHTCYSTENVSIQLECDSTVDAIRNTPVLTSQEQLLSMNDSHCANIDQVAVGKDTDLDNEKDTGKLKTPSDKIQNLLSRGKKRKHDTLEENSRHKKMMKTGDGLKLKVESRSPKTVHNKTTSEKESGRKKRRRTEECREKEHKTSVKSVVVRVDTSSPRMVQGELPGRSEKRHRNKDRHRKHASSRTHQVGCERKESSSSSTARSSKAASSLPRHVSSRRTRMENRESKRTSAMEKQDVSKNVATNSGHINIFRSEKKRKEEPLLDLTKRVSDSRTTTPDVRSKSRGVGKEETNHSSYSTRRKIRDSSTRPENGQPVPVLYTNRQESSCFRKPENPPYKAIQSRPRLSQSYRYSPYQYQHQHQLLNQQYVQQYQQQTIYNWARNPVLCQPQAYCPDQQRAGNVYINANHPAMRHTVAEWERLMSFHGHNRYY